MADGIVNGVKFYDKNNVLQEERDINDIDHDEFAKVDGAYEQMTVGNAEQLISDHKDTNLTPYLFRKTGGGASVGDRKYVKGITGGTVAWNQLASLNPSDWVASRATVTVTDRTIRVTSTSDSSLKTASVAIVPTHAYLIRCKINGGANGAFVGFYHDNLYSWRSGTDSGTVNPLETIKKPASSDTHFKLVLPTSTPTGGYMESTDTQLFDLTAAFDSTIADYIYSLETATVGAGIAKLKSWGFLDKNYYPYDAGSLKSVGGLVSSESVGFNQFDEVWESGDIDSTTGEETTSTTRRRSVNKIPVVDSATYYGKASGSFGIRCYSGSDAYLGSVTCNGHATFTLPSGTNYIRTVATNGVSADPLCISLSSDLNGEYEAYQKRTYPLDSSLTLRGIPKLNSANELYYDGDVYESDGTVTRKYGIVDLGTLDWNRYSSGNFFRVTIPDALSMTVGSTEDLKKGICTKYDAVDSLSAVESGYNWSGNIFRLKDTAYTTVASFKQMLTDENIQLVYSLATESTEEADPYTELQIIDPNGTEAFNVTPDSDGVAIPVGHTTEYPLDLKGKIESAPNLPNSNGVYAVQYNNGVATYIPLGSDTTIANILQRLTALEGGS